MSYLNVTLWAVGGTTASIVGWFLYSAGLGVVRLRPQIDVARKKTRQQKDSLRVASLDTATLLFEAQRGDPAAQTRAGLMFAHGNGLPHDDVKALEWFERAAAGGFAEAQYYAGLAYEHGRGVTNDYARSRSWYEKSARNGNAPAQCNLGILYLRHLGEKEDWVTAAYWFLKSASQDNETAITNLHWLIKHMESAPQGSKASLARYTESAQRGDADAAFFLGWCHESGFLTSKALDTAVDWYERAENIGHLYAGKNLRRLLNRTTVP